MTYNPGQHFTARPDGYGGVTLTPRFRFRDVMGTYVEADGIARSREVDDGVITGAVRSAATAVKSASRVAEQDDEFLPGTRRVRDQDNGTSIEQTLFVFGPTSRGQSYKFNELPNGTVAVVLVSAPEDLIGNSLESGGVTSGTSDARTRYLAGSYGRNSQASQLASQNANNRKYYGR